MVVKFLFFFLGVLLYIYVVSIGIDIFEWIDEFFLMIVFNYLLVVVGIFFVLGFIVVVYLSVDFVFIVLMIFFCVDFLNFEKSDVLE